MMPSDISRIGAQTLDRLYSGGKNTAKKIRPKGTAYYGATLGTRKSAKRYNDRLTGKEPAMEYFTLEDELKKLED